MPGQFYPVAETEFATWAFNFANEVPAIVTALGLPVTVDDAFIAARTAFATAYNNHVAAQADAQNIRQVKDVALTTMTNELRNLVKILRAQTAFTDAMALQLGLPVYDTTPGTATAVQTDVPELLIDNSTPGHHIVDFSPAGADSSAKPDWAKACRIIHKIGTSQTGAPTITEMSLLAVDTSTPYSWDIPAGNIGSFVWYRAAWENAKGELGGWSEVAKATVTG